MTDPTAADMSLPSWVSHSLTGLGVFLGTRFLDFVLARNKQQDSRESDLLTRCLVRIGALEQQVTDVQKQLLDSARGEARLTERVADLTKELIESRAEVARLTVRVADLTRELLESRQQESNLRAEVAALKGKS